MDGNILQAKVIIGKEDATVEECKEVLRTLVAGYSERPRVVIYLDDYDHLPADIIREVADKVEDYQSGLEPDWYWACQENYDWDKIYGEENEEDEEEN